VSEAEVTIRRGESLLSALNRQGLFVHADCGGAGRCNGCFVRVNGRRHRACTFSTAGNWRISRDHPVELRPSILPDRPATGRRLGLAVDLGTTTVGTAIVDLASGRTLASRVTANLQRVYGEDVLSRLNFGLHPEHRVRLAELAVHTILSLTAGVFEDAGASLLDLEEVRLAGNASMTLLLLERDPIALARAPFCAGLRAEGEIRVDPARLGLPGRVRASFLPAIGGHVGSDTTAAALASGILDGALPALLVDLGTNGEVVLATEAGALAASSAAGPAFEGGGVSQGSPARPGAIERVRIEAGGIVVETAGGGAPVSWCGSGVVELLAVLRDLGDLDASGRLLAARALPVPFTQADVREVQLAKGAVATAVRILLAEAGIPAERLTRIVLTGAFGSHVPAAAARRIGLLPAATPVTALPGGALLGAAAAMLPGAEGLAGDIVTRTRHVPLADRADFEAIFVDSLALREMDA
jgi:uncharacterized 2Fe-2S/4Fe-4S cluster protein (DUF4445 family)